MKIEYNCNLTHQFFVCVCALIDDVFHHNIVKLAVDP